jgi:hypothetical protein
MRPIIGLHNNIGNSESCGNSCRCAVAITTKIHTQKGLKSKGLYYKTFYGRNLQFSY